MGVIPIIKPILVSFLSFIIDNKFTVSATSKVTITTFSEELSYDSVGYKVFNDMLDRTHFKRISDNDSTKLAADLLISDKEITLTDTSFFDTPSIADKTPGVVWIDRERIEFYKITGNKLGQITRGTLGTGIKDTHKLGSLVFDAGPEQTVPYKEDINVYESVISPNLPNGMYNKGDILITMGKIEEGIVWVSKAIALRPNWPLYYCNRVK